MTLVLSFLFYSATYASAAAITLRKETLQKVVEDIASMFPESEIFVEDDVINVVVPGSFSTNATMGNSAYTSSSAAEINTIETVKYAPDGGTWTSFEPPLIYTLNPSLVRPWSVVYIPSDEAKVLYDGLVVDGLVEFVTTALAAGTAAEALIDKIFAKFGIVFTLAQIAFMIAKTTMDSFTYLNKQSFAKAYLESDEGKVRIDFCTMDGWSVNLYYSWEGEYVSNEPWQDFTPKFQRGVINL